MASRQPRCVPLPAFPTVHIGLPMVLSSFRVTCCALGAAHGPVTPGEVDYTWVLRETFWALVNQGPTVPDYDGEPAADVLALCMLLAAMSLDRGGYAAAAEACYESLAYMKSLPGFSGVALEITPDGASFTIVSDPESPD
jgi:hypothetical protein